MKTIKIIQKIPFAEHYLNKQKKSNRNNIIFNANQFAQKSFNIQNSPTTTFKSNFKKSNICYKKEQNNQEGDGKVRNKRNFEANNKANYISSPNIFNNKYQNDFDKKLNQKNINNSNSIQDIFSNWKNRDGIHNSFDGEENDKISNNGKILRNNQLIRNNNDAIENQNNTGNFQYEIRIDIEDHFDQLLFRYPIKSNKIFDYDVGLKNNIDYLNYTGEISDTSAFYKRIREGSCKDINMNYY